jgi:hypothetical protein
VVSADQLPATVPLLVFLHPPDEDYARLRGFEFFEALRANGMPVLTSADGDDLVVPPRKPVMVFAAVGADADYVDCVTGLARRDTNPLSCVLVDVCGPFWDPPHLIGSDTVRGYWQDPGNQQRARQLLRGVDGVTTPHASYTPMLGDFHDQVFVLPDLVDDDEDDHGEHEHGQDGHCCERAVEVVRNFGMTLMTAWHTAALAKASRRR